VPSEPPERTSADPPLGEASHLSILPPGEASHYSILPPGEADVYIPAGVAGDFSSSTLRPGEAGDFRNAPLPPRSARPAGSAFIQCVAR